VRPSLTFASDWSNEINMNIDELKQAHDLMKRIEATASLLPAYRKAESIIAAIPQTEAEKRSLRGSAGLPRHDEVTFTAAEIGDQIVSALERRIAMMTEELQKLGVETAPRLREV
jgi:molecular chaperone DnaK (HSP70)